MICNCKYSILTAISNKNLTKNGFTGIYHTALVNNGLLFIEL